MEINWLTAPEMNAWRAYIETYADLANALERDLSEFDLTLGDYQLLVYLSEAPDQAMRMCDLAEMLQLSPSGLTRRLDGLVAAGCVVRQASPVDRRVMLGVLTEAGRALAGHRNVRAAIPVAELERERRRDARRRDDLERR